jgi:hypothetical protein
VIVIDSAVGDPGSFGEESGSQVSDQIPGAAVPPIEPAPVVAAAAVVPPPPTVDPYATPVYAPPPPVDYSAPGYAPGTYAPAYQSGYYAPPQPPKGLAIASMVTGIVGVFFSLFYGLGLFPSIAAIITGHLAQKRQPYAKGFWIAGLVTGYVGLLLSLIGVAILVFVIVLAASGGFNDS